jgi:hypothetical protein
MNKQGAAVSRPPFGKSSFEVAEQLLNAFGSPLLWRERGRVRVVEYNGADAPNPSPQSSPLGEGERREGLLR